MTLPLQSSIIYGPINSRRLGKSLGINLSPVNVKACSFDCIYCQYGRTEIKTCDSHGLELPSVEAVAESIENALRHHIEMNYITFSGNGEPSLHPEFEEIVKITKELRDNFCPSIPIAILTNSSRLDQADVLRAMRLVDVIIAKLDAGDDETFRAINRPCERLSVERVIEGLESLEAVVIQSLKVQGRIQNVEGKAFENWVQALRRIRAREVQIYTADRPVAESSALRVPKAKLKSLAYEVESRTGIRTRAY